jgi:hypothetical protein
MLRCLSLKPSTASLSSIAREVSRVSVKAADGSGLRHSKARS